MTFNWVGLGGQPSWLWGGNDGANMNVYDPVNFSVNYATTAGNGGVTSVNGSTGAVTVSVPAPTTAQVGTATAGLAAFSVGSYASLLGPKNTSIVAGSSYSGLFLWALFYLNASDMLSTLRSATTVPGTWRAMGSSSATGTDSYANVVFLRIA